MPPFPYVVERHSSRQVEVITFSLVDVQNKTIEEMYELYRLHPGVLGFSIRKYTSRIGRVEGNVYLTKEKYFFTYLIRRLALRLQVYIYVFDTTCGSHIICNVQALKKS